MPCPFGCCFFMAFGVFQVLSKIIQWIREKYFGEKNSFEKGTNVVVDVEEGRVNNVVEQLDTEDEEKIKGTDEKKSCCDDHENEEKTKKENTSSSAADCIEEDVKGRRTTSTRIKAEDMIISTDSVVNKKNKSTTIQKRRSRYSDFFLMQKLSGNRVLFSRVNI